MPIEERGVTNHRAKSCKCESCKRTRNEPHKISYGLIHEYSEAPRGGWSPRMTLHESLNGIPNDLLLGVELETHIPYDQSTTATVEEAASMKRPASLWLPKHDSSVSGPEFASQPASLAYWQAIRPALEEMFTMLLHAGIRSHEGDTCGMHVNISTKTFGTREHLIRFANLIHVNKRWTRRMSQRTLDSSQHWAKLDGTVLTQTDTLENWAQGIIDYGAAGNDRYMALNALNANRVEFRLPRGTLRLDRFYKNLEWTAAMVEYSRDGEDESGKVKAMVPASFMRWTLANRESYPDFANYIEEKFAASVAVGDAVAA